MADQVNPVVVDPAPPPPLPPPSRHHRPRVREVSSRFMSSIASPSPSDAHHHQNHHHVPKSPVSRHTPMPTPDTHSRPLQRSKSAQRQRGGGVETEAAEPLKSRSVDDNNVQLDTTRSLESPLKGVLHGVRGSVVQRNSKRSGASVKLVFKENNGGNSKSEHQQPSEVLRRRGGNGSFTATPSRPDTPMVTPSTSTDHRVVSSRFRLSGSVQKGGIGPTATTAAAKLLQSSGMMSSSFNAAQLPPNPHASNSNGNGGALGRENDTCPAPSNPSSDCGLGSDSEEDVVQKDGRLRSSLPEVEVSSRLLGDRSCSVGNNGAGCNSSKLPASPCSRSLNLPLSSYDHSSSLLHTVGRPGEKPAKPLGNSGKTGSLCLPPLPCPKQGGDSKKGRKDSSHAEQVHSLKLLHNHHLQWRFANAKAEATMHAQRREAERDLYSLQVKLSNLRDAVERKQIELGLWKRTQTISTILEAHMPYLDEWSALEAEYLSSLSGVIDALVNASLQLPVGGNVQVDTKEVREALNAALKMTESICLQIQNFMPKAEEMDTSMSELARVSGGERALIEECGHLLSKTYTSQVEECSLRGHLVQLHSSNHHQAKEEQAFLPDKF